MYYEKYGVNIVKNIFKNNWYFISLFIISMLFVSCSKKEDNNSEIQNDSTNVVTQNQTPPTMMTVKDTIETALSEAMERLIYYDNSGLYENEFSYLTDDKTFDEYLTFGQITYHDPVDVLKLVIDSLNMFAHDSAAAWASVTLKFEDGSIKTMNEQLLKVYYHKGKWIKPTVSVIKNQVAYDELIRQAEEAAKWENQ